MDCRRFHALSGRQIAPSLVSSRLMLFEGRRIDDPKKDLRIAEIPRAFNYHFWPRKASAITDKQRTPQAETGRG
jgi:hypothetical protein